MNSYIAYLNKKLTKAQIKLQKSTPSNANVKQLYSLVLK